ncbi:hypothetical protein PVAP13_8KG019401 [Panicum virgatum]|uniref:Trichome birefringence-like C-terminal domain-containing protein n=1 Tax=Panicum virgatum TaxID=38727 RepID=A0A8T0PBR3_PANVG|nr:hypothetical protein PVAP13_8KG019401 [Panicum virgatum]
MKPEANPKMMVLSSPVGLRSIINSLVAFSIIVSSVTLLFYQGQEGQVPMVIEHEHPKMQVQMVAEHHEQLRVTEAPVPLTAELPDARKEECNWSTGRKDVMYQHWRWQPYRCDLPRFNATRLLEKLRNKRLVFVGDSLNRNQWVSLVCMVEASIPDNRLKMRVFNGSLISFKAFEYNATVDFYWSPLLVESNSDDPIVHRVEYRIIRADRIEKHANAWRDADIIIFNAYVWWRKHKADMRMKVMYGSFENGDARLEEVEMVDGFEIALKKLTEWLGENIDKNKTRIFFAGSSPTHSCDGSDSL